MEERLTRLSLAVMGARLSKLYELNIWAMTLGRPREEWMVVATDSQAASHKEFNFSGQLAHFFR